MLYRVLTGVSLLLACLLMLMPVSGQPAAPHAMFLPIVHHDPQPTPTTDLIDCDPSYPTLCLPTGLPDDMINCEDIPLYSMEPYDFVVLPPDPYGLDADGDGIGCESSELPTPTSDCEPSYPSMCLPIGVPDEMINCEDIPLYTDHYNDFMVLEPDPYNLDEDNDGFGCEAVGEGDPVPLPTPTTRPYCDASYPDFCILSPPPDLACRNVPYRQSTVLPLDPHRFGTDNDGLGCE